jgi:RNA polymerase sigma-70 factor, ECF subfamily
MSAVPQRVRTAVTFEECYRAHRHSVYRIGLRYGNGSVGWAEDLAHDVFLKLLEHLERLEDPDDLGGWLYRVATNLALDRLRRERSLFGRLKTLLRGASPEATSEVDRLLSNRQDSAAAVRALESLPPRERAVASMHLIDGKSQKEIVEALSLSKGYVSKILGRALSRLRAAGWRVDERS